MSTKDEISLIYEKVMKDINELADNINYEFKYVYLEKQLLNNYVFTRGNEEYLSDRYYEHRINLNKYLAEYIKAMKEYKQMEKDGGLEDITCYVEPLPVEDLLVSIYQAFVSGEIL